MNKLTLDKLAYAIQQRLSTGFVSDVRVDVSEIVYDQVIVMVRMNLFSKDAGVYTYKTPKTWKDRLKQDIRWVRRVFGNPEYNTTRLMTRVVLDPTSYRPPPNQSSLNIVPMDTVDWNAACDQQEYVEYNEMRFYPTIFKTIE